MSDFDTLSASAVDSAASSEATLFADDALDATLRKADKAALFTVLAAAGITQVVIAFDGYGDSGQVESVEAKVDDDPVDLPDTTVRVCTTEWGNPEPVARDLPVADLIERLAYDYLGDTHGGWENGDGAYGEFVFDVANGTITLDHNDRYIAVETYSHQF